MNMKWPYILKGEDSIRTLSKKLCDPLASKVAVKQGRRKNNVLSKIGFLTCWILLMGFEGQEYIERQNF